MDICIAHIRKKTCDCFSQKIMHQKKKGMNHDLPETWKETHDSQKRKCWTDGAEDAYDKLKQLKDQSMESGSTPKSDEGSHVQSLDANQDIYVV